MKISDYIVYEYYLSALSIFFVSSDVKRTFVKVPLQHINGIYR